MGLVPKRRTAAYQASKFGLVGLSLSLRAEYSPSVVGVSVICPGLVGTQLMPSAGASGMLDKKPKIKSWWLVSPRYIAFFFFNDTATTEIYTLSLHDALPI